MTKKLISILLSVIILFGTFVCTFAQEEKETNFVVTSDLHYVSPCENKEDYLYAETFSLNKDGKKLQNESSFIIDAFLEQCKADIECDFILVSGDLVSYGRDYATEHEALAQKFASFEEETGKQVYVINGNHDNGVVKYLKADEKLKDEDVLKLMFSWAETVKSSGEDIGATAYKIDKIIWLLCTDEFYLDDRRVGREAIYRKIDALR